MTMQTPTAFLHAGIYGTGWVAVTELPTADRVKPYSYFCEISGGKLYPISIDTAKSNSADEIVMLYDGFVFEHCIYHPGNSIAA